MPLLPFQFVIHVFCFLRQGDGVHVEVAVENGGAAGESSGEGAGKATQEQVLTWKKKKKENNRNVHAV